MSWPDSGPPLADEVARLARDVRRGLTARPRWLPPKYFYDAAGAPHSRARAHPALDVPTVGGDFQHGLDRLPSPAGRPLGLFLGSTIGNFDPPACQRLLGALGRNLGPGGRLLLGVDLVKDRGV